MWPFKEGSFLDPDIEAWQIDTWCFFLERFGGVVDLKRSPLVTPTSAFFPPTDKTGQARAEYIFYWVRRLARLDEFPCTLVAQPPDPPIAGVADRPTELGTFRMEGRNPVITYDPAALENPLSLVAIFAHELAHYRLKDMRKDLPCGEDTQELATDLMTIYMGFGLFGADMAYNFRSYNWGRTSSWSYSTEGYLSERSWIFGLAVFLSLREQSPEEADHYLKPYLCTDLRTALHYLKRHPPALR